MNNTEKRIYAIDASELKTNIIVTALSDDEFMTIAEGQGKVWSGADSFAESFNNDEISDQWFLRVIAHAAPEQSQRKDEPNTKPLYKVLNEQRTQGNWSFGRTGLAEYPSLWVGGTIIAKMEKIPHEDNEEVNAKYAALSVSNLHILAERLEKLITIAASTTADIIAFEGAEELDNAIDEAKDALSKIS